MTIGWTRRARVAVARKAREMIVPPYRILYLATADRITILTLEHSRERLRARDLKLG